MIGRQVLIGPPTTSVRWINYDECKTAFTLRHPSWEEFSTDLMRTVVAKIEKQKLQIGSQVRAITTTTRERKACKGHKMIDPKFCLHKPCPPFMVRNNKQWFFASTCLRCGYRWCHYAFRENRVPAPTKEDLEDARLNWWNDLLHNNHG